MDDEIRQFKYIYQSTLAFEKFIREKLNKSKNVLDIGCGRAGTLSYYVKKYKKINFIGTDYRYKYISIAKKIYKKLKLDINTKFYKVDIFEKINNQNIIRKKIDGVISEKTFCTFKDIEKPLKNIMRLNPRWIAINSLFYKGYMDAFIHMREKKNGKYSIKENNPDADFNIHSLLNLTSFLKKKGYRIAKIQSFFPKKKIKRNTLYRGTYTLKTEFNKFTCFSGPVYLPWKFILIEKKIKSAKNSS
tara:strand:+ start:98 stop:835 length:738 start_codon:yes stop_codon:yes gene_type:complete